MAWYKTKSSGKFKAQRTADGFPSKLERAVYHVLLLRERAKEIFGIKRQVPVQFPCGPRWEVDFQFTDAATGADVLCEAKGVETDTYRLKRRMYGGCPLLEKVTLEVWKGTYLKPRLAETVRPRCGHEVKVE